MKYITRLATTEQVRKMTAALKKAFSNNTSAKLEIDWNTAKVVRLTLPKYNRPLYMALCKKGDIWMTSYPDNLFI